MSNCRYAEEASIDTSLIPRPPSLIGRVACFHCTSSSTLRIPFPIRSVTGSIVLYPYIYIALLAVHTNQKRFQCKRPREKRAVLRERKEALGSPVNKVDRVEERSWFQSEGPMIARKSANQSSSSV